jgi:Urocanase Rossmann-like domain
MAPSSTIDPALQAELEAVYAFYAGLTCDLDPQSGSGGKLLYAGELDQDGARLVRAANIAGAASLSATSDVAAQRLAIRDGVIDFLVTSLDEALRILKNEIRKRNGVAVGIADSPSKIVVEMRERGVLPDLVSNTAADAGGFIAQGAQVVHPAPLPADHQLVALLSPAAEFEHRALELLAESDYAARRWLRLSPRYLGPNARRVRSVPANAKLAAELNRDV